VFDASGASYVNETTDINDVGTNDVALQVDIGDILYIGGAAQFNIVSIITGQRALLGAVAWEYWNGSAWAALPDLVDGTNAFINTGTNNVTFDIPTNWVTVAVNASTQYWVRARVTTALTNSPAISQGFVSAAGNITADVTYVMSFVRTWSDGTIDESGPSPVSNSLTLNARPTSVTLPDGTMATEEDYGITHKRLYRSEGGNYFFVSESIFATASATDNVLTQNLGDAIETIAYLPPPDAMDGLIVLPNGVHAGFKGKTVYLSDPYRPHAYPLVNQHSFSWDVVALANVGSSILVLTKAYPYIGRGIDPAAYAFKREPGLLACASARSVASGEYGVFWAAPMGLCLFDGATTKVITREFMTREEWRERYYPDTIHGLVHDGHYFGWFQTDTDDAGRKVGGGFVLDKTERAFLVDTDEYVDAAYVIPERTELWFVRRNTLDQNWTYQWDAVPGAPSTYQWKSKEFISVSLENYAFAQVFADFAEGLTPAEEAAIQAQIDAALAYNALQTRTFGELGGGIINTQMLNGDAVLLIPPSLDDFVIGTVTFKYWADGALKLLKEISSNDPFPLPSGFMAERHEFEVSGRVRLSEVTLASSMEELAQT
jgi:hypothetical protein